MIISHFFPKYPKKLMKYISISLITFFLPTSTLSDITMSTLHFLWFVYLHSTYISTQGIEDKKNLLFSLLILGKNRWIDWQRNQTIWILIKDQRFRLAVGRNDLSSWYEHCWTMSHVPRNAVWRGSKTMREQEE